MNLPGNDYESINTNLYGVGVCLFSHQLEEKDSPWSPTETRSRRQESLGHRGEMPTFYLVLQARNTSIRHRHDSAALGDTNDKTLNKSVFLVASRFDRSYLPNYLIWSSLKPMYHRRGGLYCKKRYPTINTIYSK